MSLSLSALRRLAADVAVEEHSDLEVLGSTRAEGSADYVELIFGLRGSVEFFPGKIVIMVKRRLSESEIRDTLRDQLRAHLHATA
jgi:hypothetical protein